MLERINYPNPQKIRKSTEELNGVWQFGYDGKVWQNINVPFCPESKLSGIGNTDFIPVCYYKRKFNVKNTDGRVLINFGAVDYLAELYINDKYVGQHVGGFTPFAFDITDFVKEGENEIYLLVRDEKLIDCAHGKQSYEKYSFGCLYTRTTGIWQSVWLEYVPENRINEFYFYPDAVNSSVTADMRLTGKGSYEIEISFGGKVVGRASGEADYKAVVKIPLAEKHLWEVGKGELYDVKLKFGDDEIYSYFGLREVCYKGYDFLLNGKKVFQKLVLDQGFYPDGIYTAPSVHAMQRDIDLALDLGFNGARLHQKVFDPKFLYLCDRAGYMVWGEFPSWGLDCSSLTSLGQTISEWNEALARDFNHPSIISWCPLNEVWGNWMDIKKDRDARYVDAVYEFTKNFDITRPCVAVSGGHNGRHTDVYDFHCYEPVEQLKKYLDELENEDKLNVALLYNEHDEFRYQKGLPVNVSEYGGIAISGEKADDAKKNWGYGKCASDGENFVKRYGELTKLIMGCSKVSGLCYTQLYDVEQEQNGFYYYDRSDKLTEEQKAEIRKINSLR